MNEMRKSPALAGFLSMMPGLGQAYVGYYTQGFINILIFGSCIATMDKVDGIEPLLAPFTAFFWMFNIIDAVRKAKLYNAQAVGEQAAPIPTDSPLVGGVILLLIGFLLTLRITLDVDLEWLEDVWPLGLMAGGGYLVWKYRKAQRELRTTPSIPIAPPPPDPSLYASFGDDPTISPSAGEERRGA
ncbi:MAG: hypothetical protein IT349_05020 [Candidatus Eisenbacteria bacterium]|nr:hypothetical protein [Candidatus Eisenbacteria bacterium]MCC7141445.1 hypothetical protein [Candidatus Eisenbacteria bacterium]